MTFAICIVVIAAVIFAAYRIYFKSLFEKVKKNLVEEKKYSQIIKSDFGSEKTAISYKNKIHYKNKMESAEYRCNIISDKNNKYFYPIINNCENICEKIFLSKKLNNTKDLADAKIASLFDFEDSHFYHRYDDGKLIISNNKSVQDTFNQIKKV